MRFSHFARALKIAALLFNAPPAWAIDQPLATPPPPTMSGHSSQAAPGREAYTADHQLRVRLLAVPSPIPMEKYFSLQLAIYDGNDPLRPLPDAQVQVTAAMSHGMAQGFAHGMQSSPRVEIHDGIATVSGMFFHMTGDWTLQVSVHAAGRSGTVSFYLPCCEQ